MFGRGNSVPFAAKFHPAALADAFAQYEAIRGQLSNLVAAWDRQIAALEAEASATLELGDQVGLLGSSFRLFATTTRGDAAQTKALAQELRVMMEEVTSFQDRDIVRLESKFRELHVQGKAVTKLRKKGYLHGDVAVADAEDGKVTAATAIHDGYMQLVHATIEAEGKALGRWMLICHTLAEWWLASKSSSYREQLAALQKAQVEMPSQAVLAKGMIEKTRSGKALETVEVTHLFIAPSAAVPATPPVPSRIQQAKKR